MTTFQGHADGERRGLDRIGGQHHKGLSETRPWAPSDRPESLALAVHMLRAIRKNRAAGIAIMCGTGMQTDVQSGTKTDWKDGHHKPRLGGCPP